MAPRKKPASRGDKPDRGEADGTLEAEGRHLPSLEGAAAATATEGDTMADGTDTVTQDEGQDTGQDAPDFTVTLSAPEADGVIVGAVEALAAALKDAAPGSRAEVPQLADNPTAGAASSQAYKYRVALKDRGILTRAKVRRVDPNTKGKDTPHRWSLTRLLDPVAQDAPTDADTPDEDQGQDTPTDS